MSILQLRSVFVPASLAGPVAICSHGIPKFWATLWADVINGGWKASTKRDHLRNVDRLYAAAIKQRGADTLDRMLAERDIEALHDLLIGFLAQLRNEVAIEKVDRTAAWNSALAFVLDILRYGSAGNDVDIGSFEARALRLETMYRQLAPPASKAPPPIRALPPLVVEDLYEIFDPNSARNPFKTERLRWRNLLLFMILLRFGLRRGEGALLLVDSFKDDRNPKTGKLMRWLDVDTTDDDDPRYEEPGLKTPQSRRQIPVSQEILMLRDKFVNNHRGISRLPQLFLGQKGMPLSLRSINEVFEIATRNLSPEAKLSLTKQKLTSVSCHDLRHTCAVVRMRRYQDAGADIDKASEKLRLYFGWSADSNMPRLYAKAYFETGLAEVWDETFDTFTDALRRATHRAGQ